MMSVNVLDTAKQFDIPDGDSIKTVTVRNLTLKQKDDTYKALSDIIKDRRRREFMALASFMEGRDRMQFLVEAAASNAVTQDDVAAEAQTVDGVSYLLDLAAEPKLDWKAILTDPDRVALVLKMYYWALNIEVPDIPELNEAEEGGSPAAPFPVPPEGS
jgi:hypothetical protein